MTHGFVGQETEHRLKQHDNTSIILKLLVALFAALAASHFVDKQIEQATTLQKLRLLIATSMFCKFATIACIFAIMVIAIKHSF